MSVARNAIQHTALLAACTMLVAATMATHAIAADSNDRANAPAASSACKAARQQAWFARQLRMTEGDNEPLRPAEPAACAPMETAQAERAHGNAPGARSADSPKDRR